MPPLAVVATTFVPDDDEERFNLRLNAWRTAYTSWRALPGPLRLYVGDDGSSERALNLAFDQRFWQTWPEAFVSVRQPGAPGGVGASLNRAVDRLLADGCEDWLYLVDDWALGIPPGPGALQIPRWREFMATTPDVGAVRVGLAHPGTRGVVRWSGPELNLWYLLLEREGYAYGHRPTLHSRRFTEALGPFVEGVSAVEVERLANERYRDMVAVWDVPSAVLALSDPFWHVDSFSMAEQEPAP